MESITSDNVSEIGFVQSFYDQIRQGEPSAEVVCPVCLEGLPETALGCGHALCERCLRIIFYRDMPCPICRLPISTWIRLFLTVKPAASLK